MLSVKLFDIDSHGENVLWDISDRSQTAYMNGICYISIWSPPLQYTAEVLNWLFPRAGLRSQAEVLCQQDFGDFKHCKTSHLAEKTLALEMRFSLVLSHPVNLPTAFTLSSPVMSKSQYEFRPLYFLSFPLFAPIPASYLLISSPFPVHHPTSLLGSWPLLCVWNLTDPGQEFALYHQRWGP